MFVDSPRGRRLLSLPIVGAACLRGGDAGAGAGRREGIVGRRAAAGASRQPPPEEVRQGTRVRMLIRLLRMCLISVRFPSTSSHPDDPWITRKRTYSICSALSHKGVLCTDTGYEYADTDTAILYFSKSKICRYGKYIYYK